jgi:hypothetical protein
MSEYQYYEFHGKRGQSMNLGIFLYIATKQEYFWETTFWVDG